MKTECPSGYKLSNLDLEKEKALTQNQFDIRRKLKIPELGETLVNIPDTCRKLAGFGAVVDDFLDQRLRIQRQGGLPALPFQKSLVANPDDCYDKFVNQSLRRDAEDQSSEEEGVSMRTG